MLWPRNTRTRCSPQACLIARTVASESSLVRSTPRISAPQARDSGVTERSMTSCMSDPPRQSGGSCSGPGAPRSGLHHDIVILQPDREGFRHIRSFHQLGPGADRNRVLPDAEPRRIAPGFAGADIELPAVPRALHHLAGPGIAIFPRNRRLDQAGLNAVRQAAAAVRAAIVER